MVNKTFEIMNKKSKNNQTKVDKSNSDKVNYERNKDVLSILRNIWKFLWYDDSVWSWLANVVVAYLFIVFIFYPGLGLLLNTSYPLVAVVSGSMEHMKISHDNNINPHLCGFQYSETDYFVDFDEYWEICGNWYEIKNITKQNFSNFNFKNGFNKGDLIFIYGTKPKNLKIGDVIVFKSNIRPEPIIHRIVDINEINGELIFTTKGDHNKSYGNVDIEINENNILGRGLFRVPLLGWFKIWVTNLLTNSKL